MSVYKFRKNKGINSCLEKKYGLLKEKTEIKRELGKTLLDNWPVFQLLFLN